MTALSRRAFVGRRGGAIAAIALSRAGLPFEAAAQATAAALGRVN